MYIHTYIQTKKMGVCVSVFVCVCLCACVRVCVRACVKYTGVGYNHGVCPYSLRASRARTTLSKGFWCSSSPSRTHELLTGIAEAGMGGRRRSKVLNLCANACIILKRQRALIHLHTKSQCREYFQKVCLRECRLHAPPL
jgi:hypothetical protein